MKHLGNGEGLTTLILTDAESRLIRELLAGAVNPKAPDGEAAFNRGIRRATDRIKAEFDQEQKARKVAAAGMAALRSLGVEPTAAAFDNAIAKDIEAEQKDSMSLKSDQAATVQKGKT